MDQLRGLAVCTSQSAMYTSQSSHYVYHMILPLHILLHLHHVMTHQATPIRVPCPRPNTSQRPAIKLDGNVGLEVRQSLGNTLVT